MPMLTWKTCQSRTSNTHTEITPQPEIPALQRPPRMTAILYRRDFARNCLITDSERGLRLHGSG
jgi:hypothetical protein